MRSMISERVRSHSIITSGSCDATEIPDQSLAQATSRAVCSSASAFSSRPKDVKQIILLADLPANDCELRGGVSMLEAPIRSCIGNPDRGFEFFRKRAGRAESREFVFRNCDAIHVAAPNDRPACVAPAAQTFEFVGRDDVFVGDDALMGFPVPGTLLLCMTDAFAAGLLPLFEAAAGVAMCLNRGQRRNGHGFQDSRIRHGRAQGFQRAVNRNARLLLVAVGIGNLAQEVAKFADTLDDHREPGNIRKRAERFNIGIDFAKFLLGFGHGTFRVLHRTRLRAAAIEQAAKDSNLRFGGNACDHLIDITAPFEFGREPLESRLGRRQFGTPLGQIGFAGSDLDAAIAKLCDVFGAREQAVIED